MKTHSIDCTSFKESVLTILPKRKCSEEAAITDQLDASQLELNRPTQTIERPLLDESSILLLNEDTREERACLDKTKVLLSGLVGLGVGLAMMPILNRELKELEFYGLDIHASEKLFIASTLNTLLLASATNAVNFYTHFTTKQESSCLEKAALTGTGVLSSAIPMAMLWNIELHDQKVAQSSGFDKFIAWAAVSSIPLMLAKLVEGYELLEKTKANSFDLESVGDKIIHYGVNGISLVARGISYTAIATELACKMGFEEKDAEIAGVIVGGVLANMVSATTEYFDVKSLFKKSAGNMTAKEVCTGILAAVEGLWFALPTVTAGLKYTANWNPLARGLLFVPYLASRATTEGCNVYRAFKT
jgi:hypothetical protein